MNEPGRTGIVTRVAGVDARKVSLSLSSEETKPDARLGIVIVTRHRLPSLLNTLEHLASLEETYPVIVVDNASKDNTVQSVRRSAPKVLKFTG